jgi:hypothetical protein
MSPTKPVRQNSESRILAMTICFEVAAVAGDADVSVSAPLLAPGNASASVAIGAVENALIGEEGLHGSTLFNALPLLYSFIPLVGVILYRIRESSESKRHHNILIFIYLYGSVSWQFICHLIG